MGRTGSGSPSGQDRRKSAISTATPSDTDHAKSLFFEALACADARDFVGAEKRLRAALALVPDRPSVLTNLAAALFSQNKVSEALAVAKRALDHAPGNPQAMLVVGNSLALQGRFEELAGVLQRIVADAPGDADAWAALATVFTQVKRYEEAVAAYRHALAVRPDLDYARGDLVHARMQSADWTGLEADWAALLADVRRGLPAARPFHVLSFPSTPADQLACARTWMGREFPVREPLWRGERYAHDRIRLAYVCADFGVHPTAQLMVGLFEQHDRSRFETIAVATRPSDGSAIRTRLEGAFERFIDAGDNADHEIAALLRELEVDIAVDLNTNIVHARAGVFALRPAPIQVSYLIYPGTSGSDAIDYLIADAIVLPAADRQHYAEKIVTLPETYFVTDDAGPEPKTTTSRADHGLPERGFVFCCFNNGYKITADVFDVWMRLVGEVEDSVLWLLESNADFSVSLRREAEARGVPSSRLVFAPRMSLEEHLARHRHADLFLDTLHYNAHTTACDALWMGLPVLTRIGNTFASRVAASLLNAVGLPELVAPSLDAYAARALALANAPAELAAIKARLAANRRTHPLFDTKRQTRQLEAAFEGMMARHRSGAPPEDFAVAPLP